MQTVDACSHYTIAYNHQTIIVLSNISFLSICDDI